MSIFVIFRCIMKRINFGKYSLLLSIAILITSGCGQKTTSLPPLTNSSVILAFGDSLTYGYNVDRSESYPAKLKVLTGLSVINAGISGEVSRQG